MLDRLRPLLPIAETKLGAPGHKIEELTLLPDEEPVPPSTDPGRPMPEGKPTAGEEVQDNAQIGGSTGILKLKVGEGEDGMGARGPRIHVCVVPPSDIDSPINQSSNCGSRNDTEEHNLA